MKFFDKLFRRQKSSMDIIELSTDTQDATEYDSKSTYYIKLLMNNENLKKMTEEKQFQKAIKAIPADKVAVFFNLEALGAVREETFESLEEYINSAKETQSKKAFYRGLRHGPCAIYAFTKDCIPKEFDGSCFIGLPTVLVYL